MARRRVASYPDPPDTLNKTAVARWHVVAPQLASQGPIDVVSLAAYCQVWARWQEAEAAIAKVGTLVKTPHGRAVSNPYLAVSRQAAREVRILEDRLGIGVARKPEAVLAQAEGQLLTRRQLSELLGVHMQTVTKWEHEGLPVALRGRRGRASQYKASDVREWLAAREAAKQADAVAGGLDVAQERAKKERWQARLAEQTYMVRARQLLPAVDVEKVWAARVSAARNVLLAAVASHSDTIYRAATVEGVAGVERELKSLVYASLHELAITRHPEEAGARDITQSEADA